MAFDTVTMIRIRCSWLVSYMPLSCLPQRIALRTLYVIITNAYCGKAFGQCSAATERARTLTKATRTELAAAAIEALTLNHAQRCTAH